jgi:transmembrane sensor
MSDWIERLDRARDHVRPDLAPERMQAIRNRVQGDLERQPRRRALVLAAVVVAGMLLVAGAVTQRFGSPPVALERGGSTAAETTSRAALVLEDGSTVQPLADEARIEAVESTAAKQAVRLVAGKARFDVTPRAQRKFEVEARGVTISVLGTSFVVAVDEKDVRVQVEHGHVRVSWPGGSRELRAGEQGVFDATKPVAPEALQLEVETPPAPSAEASSARPAAPPSWRALAEDGDYAKAYQRLNSEGASAIHNEPGDLLLAADVARLGGHPAKSVALLERVIKNHRGDSRAPLAAFTLGRVLLDQLGRPREAAAAFANARQLAPGGALAQDALAREVESWSRAGDAALARARANEYLERFPKGRRQKAVRRFGGLDDVD